MELLPHHANSSDYQAIIIPFEGLCLCLSILSLWARPAPHWCWTKDLKTLGHATAQEAGLGVSLPLDVTLWAWE